MCAGERKRGTGHKSGRYCANKVGDEGMGNNDSFVKPGREGLPPEEELRHFRGVAKSLLQDASKVLAELELEVSSPEAERLMELLDH